MSATLADLSSSKPSMGPIANRLAPARGWRWRDEAVGVVMVGFAGLVLVAVLPHLLPDTVLRHLDQGRLHGGVGFLACALVLFVLRAPIRAMISALAGSVMLASVALFAAGAFAPHAPERQAEVTMISFNLLGTNPRGADVAAYLAEAAPDILLVMEAWAIVDELEVIDAAFPYRVGCWPGPNCDMAIYSRHPIDGVEISPFSFIDGRLIRAEIQIDGYELTLVAAHLTKPYWGDWHDQQLDQLVETLRAVDGPVVLAGDFNSQAFVQAFRHHLIDDARLQLASRMQPTWPSLSPLPLAMAGFAIDHVLVRGDIAPVDVRLIADPLGSNHRGLYAAFDLDGR